MKDIAPGSRPAASYLMHPLEYSPVKTKGRKARRVVVTDDESESESKNSVQKRRRKTKKTKTRRKRIKIESEDEVESTAVQDREVSEKRKMPGPEEKGKEKEKDDSDSIEEEQNWSKEVQCSFITTPPKKKFQRPSPLFLTQKTMHIAFRSVERCAEEYEP